MKLGACGSCVANKSNCNRCKDNPKYADYPRTSYYQSYKPTCPKGYYDCVNDPAYIKHVYPAWYKKTYGDLTPEEASEQECNVDDQWCYDDEDK